VGTTPSQSTIAIDAEIIDLAEDFLRRRRDAITHIGALIDANAMGELRRVGHELKGTAGSYGFAELSRVGAALEAAALQENPARARDALAHMTRFLERVTLVTA
jgi:HPt (histidine-containing phosphotransfer) domain-containing protein